MWLHITMLTVHVVVFLLTEFFVFRAMEDNSTRNLLEQSYSRMALFTSQTIVQSILIYIFISVNRCGIENGEEVNRRSSRSLENTFSTVNRASGNLRMIMHIKNNIDAPRLSQIRNSKKIE